MAVVSSSPDQSPSDASPECLVLVSDTSTEAERLIASLRVRGFKVRDVPLMLLPGRVEVQRPRLVICDGQVERVIAAVTKMRAGVWGASVELLFLGLDPRVKSGLQSILLDIEERTVPRPIDVYSVLQRVEEVLGHIEVASRPGARSMAALPKIGAPSAPAMARAPTPPPRRGRSSNPQIIPRLEAIAAEARGEHPEPSSPRLGSVAPPSEASGPDSNLQGVPVARMSEELEQLLSDAEHRLATGPMSLQPVSMHGARLSPDQELDAILPPDVLAALDEPVDLDDEEETSHPVARQHRDRPSTMAPRGTGGSHRDEVSDHVTGGTSPNDEDTPVGRPVTRGRLQTAAGGSDPPRGASHAGLLTPVPVSVKTHHTHHTQANSSPQASGAQTAVPQTSDGELVERVSERELVQRQEYERRRRIDVDSVAPGTNPELEGALVRLGATGDLLNEREPASTAPPHASRIERQQPDQSWESLDDAALSMRREFSLIDEPPATVANRELVNREPSTRDAASADFGQTSSTSPPGRGRQRNKPLAQPAAEADSSWRSAAERLAVPSVPERSAGVDGRGNIEVPAALGPGDVLRALSRCVRSRYSGALAIEDETGIRRVVMREGDFVMVASGVDGESLVAFLIQRGDLDADAVRLVRKLPQFGRHAGAALIAHGYLRQDELWPVLRAHAEWLLGHALGIRQGSAGLEVDLPARLSAEPAVFGGATGAEILVEVVRRIVPPEIAIESLGGLRARLTRGSMYRLLSECALSTVEGQLIEHAAGLTLDELLVQAQNADFAAALYALHELGVLDTMAASIESVREARQPLVRDGLDDSAVRNRLGIRRSLVDEGDYFALLGISRDATGYEVRHAYLELRRELDPSRLLTASTADLREDVDLVLEVLDEAYEILRDAARRERYRRALEASPVAGV